MEVVYDSLTWGVMGRMHGSKQHTLETIARTVGVSRATLRRHLGEQGAVSR
jgi:response regulator of citrate/malate metabolism